MDSICLGFSVAHDSWYWVCPGRFPKLISRFFYGGLGRRKSSLALIWQSLMCLSIISFEVRRIRFTCNLLLVVLLGIFAYIFTYRRAFYRQSQEFWNDGCTWRGECRQCMDPRPPILSLSADVCNVLPHYP
jgi:hypothetical protein